MFRRLTLPLLAFLSFPAVASAGVPTNTVQPTVSGTPQVTQTLTRTLGTWSNSPTSYTTAWQRCTQKSGGLSCRNNIAGATGATYVIVSADVGFKLRVNITATNADGSKSRASAATAVVTNPAATPPNNTAKPTVSGTPQVGNALTASNGTWSGTTPITYAYQWQRAGTNIFGAISSRYTLTNADVGSTIEVVVMATNSLGTASATSAPTGVVVSSGGGSWPASYTNGPLGANEVLPNSNGGVLLSLWSGVVGFTSQQSRALVQRRIADMGRVPDVIGFSCSGSCAAGSGSFDASSTDLSENWIHSQGAIPLVANWDPGSSTNFAGIAAGNYDSQV